MSGEGFEVFSVEGGELTDEVFTSSSAGTFNIKRIKEWIEKNKPAVYGIQSSRKSFEDAISEIDLDEGRLEELRKRETFQPMIICMMQDNVPMILDGHHRLKIWVERSIAPTAYILPWEVVREFMVRYFLTSNGVRREIPPQEIVKRTWGIYSREAPTG